MTKSRGIRNPKGTRTIWAEEQQGRHVCGCGCGAAIPVRPEHHSKGVPQFIWGHNARGQVRREKPPQPPCECGCGRVPKTYGHRFVPGHQNIGKACSEETRKKIGDAQRGILTGRRVETYKKQVTNAGYLMLTIPEHPFAHRHRHTIMEHRVVLENYLRVADPQSRFLVEIGGVKYLSPEFDVHHIDGDKQRNVVENLMALTKAEHSELHYNLGTNRNPRLNRRGKPRASSPAAVPQEWPDRPGRRLAARRAQAS